MFYPDLETSRKIAHDCNIIPVSMEVYADMETPISLFKRFEDSRFCFLLESVEGGEKWARYSFIGRNPFITVKSHGGTTRIEYADGKTETEEGNPVEILEHLLGRYRGARIAGLPRFSGGAAGFFGYDMIRYYESLPEAPHDDLDLPELYFMLTGELLVYDHLRQKISIIVNMPTEGNIERNYNSATGRIKEIYREIRSTRWKVAGNSGNDGRKGGKPLEYKSNIGRERFCENVLKAKDYIKNGDIFQVVLSHRLCTETDKNPLDVYRALRVMNPSPYMYCLKFDELGIVGSSPEMLVRVENEVVETRPIAGTRRRGATREEDELLEKELLADSKEIAEHMMLVDLARNDIGRVSEFGTVVVKDLMRIERYSHVMHITTGVQGRLRKGLTSFDALMSIMPAGTLSGAPKVRAMQIIDELETVKRGIYGGAIGYLGFDGNLDSCITIRTIVFKNGRAYIQAGAGIVADSVPEREYEEAAGKAVALLKALEEADEIK